MMLIKQVFPEPLVSPSTYCRYFYRGEQVTGDMENKAPSGTLAVKNAGFLDATLWANAGYATVGGTVGSYCTLAPAAHDFSLATHTMIFTARVKKIAAAFPLAEQYIVSSYAPGSNNGGIILSCRVDGAARMYVNGVDASTANVSSVAGALTNGTVANERSLVFIFPRDLASSCWSALDAIENTSASAATVAGKSFAGGRDMRIGQSQTASAIDAFGLAAFAAYAVPADLSTIDRRQIYDWAFRNPGTPIPDWAFA